MGIINNDVYVCSNGVQKAGTYLSFATETLYVVQNYNMGAATNAPQTYNVRANYRIFWDLDCRQAGKSFIDLKSITANLTMDQLNNNIYSVLYGELKNLYPNCVDELLVAPPAAPVAPVAPPAAPVAPSAPSDSSSTPAAPADGSSSSSPSV